MLAGLPSDPPQQGSPDSCPQLMHTIWGQDEPYSLMCPLPDYSPWGGFLPDVVHCPTGRVATAATQLCFHVGVASEMG